MSSLLWHNINDMSGNWSGILDEEKSDLTKAEFHWNYQQRTTPTHVSQSPNYTGWPYSCGMNGDPNASPGWNILGQDNFDRVQFEMWTASSGGMCRQYFVMGSITDPYGNPIAGVNLELFVTSTNALVSVGVSDQNGNYMLPTPFNGATHFIYANYGNGTYVGASVNTLTPIF